MLPKALEDGVIFWHKTKGGHKGVKAGHALKALEEMIELCFACGAEMREVLTIVDQQLAAEIRKPNTDIAAELFDTLACLAILRHYHDIKVLDVGANKLLVLNQREWATARDGVLMRPERLAKWEEMRYG